MKLVFIMIAALSLFGCAAPTLNDLPDITAKEVYVQHQNPLFNVSVNAENVVDHGSYVTADSISYERGGRFTNTIIRVKGYRRDKHTETTTTSSTTVSVSSPVSSP